MVYLETRDMKVRFPLSTHTIESHASLRARLLWYRACFPPAERKVAAYLLTHGGEHGDIPLSDLAARAGVSKPVVVRMCQLLGFSGFSEFRLQWARESGTLNRQVRDTPGTIVDIADALDNTAELLSSAALDDAAAAIVQARRFFIYGSGGSGLIAQLAGTAFAALGKLPVTFSEAMWHMPGTRLADGQTTILVISHRGANSAIEAVTKGDRDLGATVVALTSNPSSRLARIADILLVTDRPEKADDKSLDWLAARALQITAVRALATKVCQLQQSRQTY